MMNDEGIPLVQCVTPRTEKAMPSDFSAEPFLGLDDVEAHTTRLLGTKPSASMKSSAKRFYPGDVLYSRLRPYLNKVWLADRSGLCSSEFIVLPPNEHLDGGFLKYRLNAMDFVSFANSLNAGDRPRVDFEQISSFCIPPFSLARQRRIVAKIEELFSELEAGEESLRLARRQLATYRQSLLKQAFEGKLTNKWREQNPDKLESPKTLLARIQLARQSRHELQLEEWATAVKEWESAETEEKRPPKPQKLIPIGENITVFDTPLPESWALLNLSQFVLELGQGWSPKCENRQAQGDEWSVIKTTAIQFGNFDPSANKALPKHLPPRRWLGLHSGEILITRAGPRSRCGVVCRVRGDHPRLMICDKAYRLVLFEGATSPEFVERLLCSPAATEAIEKLKTGINDSGVNITQSAFLQLTIPIPPLPEQQEIIRLLDEQLEVIERNEREIDTALQRSEALRQSILHRAFTGKLVPQDPADEPATELLARLRAAKQSAPLRKPRSSKTKP
jgi:type I restriction enzyme S subunit